MSAKKLGGIQSAIESMAGLTKEQRASILAQIAMTDPGLAEELRKHLFQFEDIVKFLPEDFRKLQQKADSKVFYIAFRGLDEGFRMELKKLLSQRAFDILMDNIESIGPQKKSRVDECRQELLQFIQDLAKKGEIALPDKWSNDEYV